MAYSDVLRDTCAMPYLLNAVAFLIQTVFDFLIGVFLVQSHILVQPAGTTSSESLFLAYAAIFGFSQQLLTQFVDKRAGKLLDVPARVRFLSMEPLLGPVDLNRHLWQCCGDQIPGQRGDGWMQPPDPPECCQCPELRNGIHWVIVGGESGPGARPMHPEWARGLRDQCASAGVPYLFKQWGEWGQYVNEDHYTHCGAERHAHAWVDSATSAHGKCWLVDDDGTWSNWTGEPPQSDGSGGRTVASTVAVMGWHGKKVAGRLLDGVQHDGFPEATK